ncbi:MAG TPA: preprotein translocase subunit SecG, partial [Woeseiaceae bacterium]|nr:preprotein translocase subunit SecG [Woeseiaceae bacterium]
MDTIQKAALIAHTLIALLIIVLVLLQRGKGADAGAAFGAGASGTVFGARGSSNFFSRATAVCATLFFVSSLGLAY